MKRKEEEQETPEQRAARNLEIFENNLASLSLPEDVVGKGAAGGRYTMAYFVLIVWWSQTGGGTILHRRALRLRSSTIR